MINSGNLHQFEPFCTVTSAVNTHKSKIMPTPHLYSANTLRSKKYTTADINATCLVYWFQLNHVKQLRQKTLGINTIWRNSFITRHCCEQVSKYCVQAVYCWLSTWMGDRLWAGKSSRYVTSHLGQLSLPSLWGREIEYRPVWLELRWGVFTCVGWQVTLCDLIWQDTQ